MKKGMFQGWRKVYHFTVKQATKGKSFMLTTFGVGILLLVVIIGIYAFAAGQSGDEEIEKFETGTVYVVNERDSEPYDFSGFVKTATEEYKNVTFKPEKDTAENVQKKVFDSKEKDALLLITGKEKLELRLAVPEGELSESDGEAFLEEISTYMTVMRYTWNGIEQKDFVYLLNPVMSQYATQGEEPEGVGEILMKMLVPMLSVLILYFMILVYGQSVGKSVAAEKTSKLMETMLLSVRPYALIFGKILAMASVGILQFLVWIAGLFGGIFGGHAIAVSMNSSFEDPIFNTIHALREAGAAEALSVPGVLLGIFSVAVGFLFYLVLAGLVASRISKAEDMAQGMGNFQIIVVAGFLISYFTVLNEETKLVFIERFVPITSVFILPSDFVLGSIPLWQGLAFLVLLLIFTMVAVVITGRFYRNQVFYQGK